MSKNVSLCLPLISCGNQTRPRFESSFTVHGAGEEQTGFYEEFFGVSRIRGVQNPATADTSLTRIQVLKWSWWE